MKRNWAVYILLMALGIFLASSSYMDSFIKKKHIETEQSDNQTNDGDEHETKRSLDDEVFLHVYHSITSPSFWVRTVYHTITDKLPHVSLSLHYPPPELA